VAALLVTVGLSMAGALPVDLVVSPLVTRGPRQIVT
jgi:hypothetical protein